MLLDLSVDDADRATALAVYVIDPHLWEPAGERRRSALVSALTSLDRQLDGRLLVAEGDPVDVVADLAREFDAASVHVSADTGPYGRRRDAAVADALDRVPLRAAGSPYAVTPGRIFTGAGGPYKVFSSYAKAWRQHGWRAPAATSVDSVDWIAPDSSALRTQIPTCDTDASTVPIGEDVARKRWRRFLDEDLADYRDRRDRPDLDGTSRMSAQLKWGAIHPRTMLRDLAEQPDSPGRQTFATELCWREFYADVLYHRPDTARGNYHRKYDALRFLTGAEAEEAFEAWASGRTGFPIVDAGMRQLNATGWMHNRLRMITASFLTKDLHLPWQRGARYFMRQLVDGDLASNQHGWQWTAGTGTDAAPYFRVFNPTAQGQRFDPSGDYIRAWVPELASVPGAKVHSLPDGPPPGYPPPIVEHKLAREETLLRYGECRE